jgi:hypothetical protein
MSKEANQSCEALTKLAPTSRGSICLQTVERSPAERAIRDQLTVQVTASPRFSAERRPLTRDAD